MNSIQQNPSKVSASKNVSNFKSHESKHKCLFKTVESIVNDETLESVSGFSDSKEELLMETLYTLKKFCIENDCSFQELFRMFDSNQKGYLKFSDFDYKIRSLGIQQDEKIIKFCFYFN